MIPWLVSHAAETIGRFQLGADGRTAYERTRGRKLNKELPEFGERIHYLKLRSIGRNKAESRWGEGIFFAPMSTCIFVFTEQQLLALSWGLA